MLQEAGRTSGAVVEEMAVDFERDDVATSCPHCPSWHRELVVHDGHEVSREWHGPQCPVVTNWL